MSINPLKGIARPRRKPNTVSNNDGINRFEAGSVRHMADGDFSYSERGIQPTPSNTVPLRVLAGFGATIQGRR